MDKTIPMYKVVDVRNLLPEELEVRLNEAYEQGYKLTTKSNIEWYQGRGEWGVFVFELPKVMPNV